MKLLSASILIPLFYLWLWLSGGQPAMCQQVRLTTAGRPPTTAVTSVHLLKLPLHQKIDSVLHHLRAYASASPGQQQRYARELTLFFAPSGYLSVHQSNRPNVRLSVADYLAQFGHRQAVTIRFGGAEVVYFGESVETATGNWQTPVTTYQNATTFAGNKPQASDIATVMVPVEAPPPTANYWQVFNMHLILPKSVSTRRH